MAELDDPNALTKEEKDQAIAWIDRHSQADLRCVVCKNDKWQLAHHIVQPVTKGRNSSILLTGPGYPCIACVCSTCGNTLLFNSVLMGLDFKIKTRSLSKARTDENTPASTDREGA